MCDPQAAQAHGIRHRGHDRSIEITSPSWLVYCALTGKTREIHFAAVANATGFVSATGHSKSARHPDVARLKTQSLVEPLRPFARAAERIVRQHADDDGDVVAASAPDRDSG